MHFVHNSITVEENDKICQKATHLTFDESDQIPHLPSSSEAPQEWKNTPPLKCLGSYRYILWEINDLFSKDALNWSQVIDLNVTKNLQ